ncbi:MAG: hypothetical protein Q7R62_03245 [bacterium]|nr:hypothetical protein [bacterium]
MRKQEILQSVERERLNGSKEPSTQLSITRARVEQISTQRSQMFNSVERYITVRLQKILREKIESEIKILLNLVSEQDRARATAKKTVYTLNKAFFEQCPLDFSSFE